MGETPTFTCTGLSGYTTIWIKSRDLAETIESGPICITDLFKNKLVAYFLLITTFI